MRSFVMMAVVLFAATTAWASSGYQLTRADLQTMAKGFSFALNKSPDRHAVEWINPTSGLQGTTVPLKSYRTSYGQICREYLATVQYPGAFQQEFGTACRQADGSWKIAGEQPVIRHARIVKQVENARRCPYFSAWHPPVQQVEQKRFHSREFLERYHNVPRRSVPHPDVQPAQPEAPEKLLKLVVN